MTTQPEFWRTVFWVCLALTLYTYFAYPLILTVLVRLRRRGRSFLAAADDTRADWPTVTMVISAYNEDAVLAEKIANCRALDYPADRLRFLIGSDGSTDGTGALLQSIDDPRFQVVTARQRRGKVRMINRLMPLVKTELVVFSDANTMYEPQAVRRLVRRFQDPRVGCVLGKLELTVAAGDTDACQTESLYWRYENRIKELESHFGMVPSINGGIFAIRTTLFETVPSGAVTEDQVLGMRIMVKGYRCVFAEDARAAESVCSWTGELRRRIRISAGNFQSLLLVPRILHPGCGRVSFAFVSHKLLRWLVPFFLVGMLASNVLLAGQAFYGGALAVQGLFYLSGIMATLLPNLVGAVKLLAIPKYFLAMNVAILIGLGRFLSGRQQVTWTRAGRP